MDLPISFHIGSGDMAEGLLKNRVATYGKMAAFTELAVDIFLRNGLQLNDLLMSGVLVRYPEIKFVSVESGIGWIPFVLEAMDYQFKGNSVAEEHPEFDLLPSEYFARNVYACYWFEQTAPRRLFDKIGVDNILFETDFPHPTSLYGDEVHARIKGGLSECEESVRRKILWGTHRTLIRSRAHRRRTRRSAPRRLEYESPPHSTLTFLRHVHAGSSPIPKFLKYSRAREWRSARADVDIALWKGILFRPL